MRPELIDDDRELYVCNCGKVFHSRYAARSHENVCPSCTEFWSDPQDELDPDEYEPRGGER